MKNTVLAVFGVAVAVGYSMPVTWAQDNCAGECQAPPVAVGGANSGFSLAIAQDLFRKGVEPSIDQLAGSWKLVGASKVPGSPENQVTEGYDPAGLKNTDGSAAVGLSIQSGKNTGQTDFAGNPVTTPPSITISGLGASTATQGPNEITLNDSDREACYAQYAYNNDGSLTKSHYNAECRLLANTPAKMICSMTLVLDPSEAAQASADDQAWNGKVFNYLAFVKE